MMEAKAQHLSSDIITTLPQTIIEIILCLLPIKEATRTSILSRDWRYKWTTIPKLVFNWKTVSDITRSRKNMDPKCKLFYAIHQVLLLRQGPIHEFTLDVEADCECFELDQIILHLSRNHTLKKLSLVSQDLEDGHLYKLPLCAFSLHQLTDLNLWHIDLDRQPMFGGFGNLRSLRLYNVNISTKAFLHLLSNCPSLTSFTLDNYGGPIGNKDCTISELFECLPVVEHLDTYTQSIIPMLVLDSILKEFPTSLIHLKYLSLKETCLDGDVLLFLSVLIKFSPNLQKINLELDYNHDYDIEICSGILEEYSDVPLEHLNELEIDCCRNMKPEMEFVKFILARSPKLKKVQIWCMDETVHQASEILKILLRAQCISRAEIVVE